MCSCVMRANCKHERHGTPALPEYYYTAPVVGDPEARDSSAPPSSHEMISLGCFPAGAPSGTDSLALEAMSEASHQLTVGAITTRLSSPGDALSRIVPFMRKGFTSFDHRARRERYNLATLHMVTTLGRAHIGHPVSPGTPQTAVPAEKYPVNFQARHGGRLPWQQQREIAAPMCTFLSPAHHSVSSHPLLQGT
ncbi:hypothetical protein PAPYR_12117 [Paratrimastix pyriformis]|uniref:Uncharacterized protein n=1 Tax=Paratrimastix pyriformis TaxID=342808 RepID=A0ABQ8U2E8_9EUKA|nr:hypothetical protein PAPYR_12117 [Paratrimastix pyriformis]